MASQQIPSPPSTPNGDAWVEMSRDAEGIQYCSEDGSATIRLELISEGRSHRWEWTSHEVIVGINMWELRESWEQGQDDELLVPPPESVPVSRPVPEEHLGRAPHPEAETPVRAPLRVVPEPQPTPEPEPIPVEVPVPSEVERNARALAAAVRGRVRTYRELFHGRVPASYEPDVAYAASQGWVVTDGDVVRLGPVDSRLPEPVGDVTLDSPRGWSRLFG